MANNDFETLARALLSGRQGQSAAGVLDKMGALLKTEDGRRLLTLLASGGADCGASRAAGRRGDGTRGHDVAAWHARGRNACQTHG